MTMEYTQDEIRECWQKHRNDKGIKELGDYNQRAIVLTNRFINERQWIVSSDLFTRIRLLFKRLVCPVKRLRFEE